MRELIDFILHVDRHLSDLIGEYGAWTYLVLFIIIFLETGLVVTPFLPGDSLLFAAGALAVVSVLNPHLLVILLIIAAIAGDAVNYSIGRRVGPRVFTKRSRFFKHEHLVRTQEFYERHGGKTIVMARFMPIVRTFAPFVAGICHMGYPRFLMYNAVGGVVWVALFVYAGFFFGNIPIIKENFSVVILVVIGLSVLPLLIEYIRQKRARPGVEPIK